MKALPKGRENTERTCASPRSPRLNESPSQKEGKSVLCFRDPRQVLSLNESLSQKEGKSGREGNGFRDRPASMKALPKKKGNSTSCAQRPASTTPQ